MYRQDYVKRQMELFAQALASIVAKRNVGQYEEALAEVQGARALLGISESFLRLDARSLVGLIGDAQRQASLSGLFEEEARIRERLGDALGATEARNRSLELAR